MQDDGYANLKFYFIGNYKVQGITLGKGNFAKVMLGTHKVIGAAVALKIIDMSRIKEHYVKKNLEREAKILARLNHPNIVKLYETTVCHDLYCLSLEFIRGGELSEHIRNHPGRRLGEVEARNLFHQIISAVGHMHRNGVLHRDLKLENILMADPETIKLVDFGLSNFYQPRCPLRTRCGSPEYAAPELFNTEVTYGTGVDVWSAGVVLYVMVVGKVPFLYPKREASTVEGRRKILYEKASRGLVDEHRETMKQLTPACQDLLHRMLEPNQDYRLTIEGIEEHVWLTSFPPPPPPAVTLKPALYQEIHNTVLRRLMAVTQMAARDLENRIHRCKFGKLYAMYHLMRDCMVKNKVSSLMNHDPRYNQSRTNLHSWMSGTPWKIPTRNMEINCQVPPANGQRISRNTCTIRRSLPKDKSLVSRGVLAKTRDTKKPVDDTLARGGLITKSKLPINACGDSGNHESSPFKSSRTPDVETNIEPPSNLPPQSANDKRHQNRNIPLSSIPENGNDTASERHNPAHSSMGQSQITTGPDGKAYTMPDKISRLTISDQNCKSYDGKMPIGTPRKLTVISGHGSSDQARSTSRPATTENKQSHKNNSESATPLLPKLLSRVCGKPDGDHNHQHMISERSQQTTVLQKETGKTMKTAQPMTNSGIVTLLKRSLTSVLNQSSEEKHILKGKQTEEEIKNRRSSIPERDSTLNYPVVNTGLLPPINKAAVDSSPVQAASNASTDAQSKPQRSLKPIETTTQPNSNEKPTMRSTTTRAKQQPVDNSAHLHVIQSGAVPKRYSLTRTVHRNRKTDPRKPVNSNANAKPAFQGETEMVSGIPGIGQLDRSWQKATTKCDAAGDLCNTVPEPERPAETDQTTLEQLGVDRKNQSVQSSNVCCLTNRKSFPETANECPGGYIPSWVNRGTKTKPNHRPNYSNVRSQYNPGMQVWSGSPLRGLAGRIEPVDRNLQRDQNPLGRLTDARCYGPRIYSNSYSSAEKKGFNYKGFTQRSTRGLQS